MCSGFDSIDRRGLNVVNDTIGIVYNYGVMFDITFHENLFELQDDIIRRIGFKDVVITMII